MVCNMLFTTFKNFYRPHIKNIFQSIAAKADGEPCCDWVIIKFLIVIYHFPSPH